MTGPRIDQLVAPHIEELRRLTPQKAAPRRTSLAPAQRWEALDVGTGQVSFGVVPGRGRTAAAVHLDPALPVRLKILTGDWWDQRASRANERDDVVGQEVEAACERGESTARESRRKS